MEDDKKPKLFEKLKQGMDEVLGRTAPRSPAGPLPGPGAPTRPVKLASPGTAPLRAASTRRLDTFERSRALPGTAPLAQPVLPDAPDAALSPRRLAIIDDYMRGRHTLRQHGDPTFMYIVVSDERLHQIQVLREVRAAFKALPPQDPRGPELLAKQAQTEALVLMLFKILKRITGKRGRTGGTGDLFDDEKGPGMPGPVER